MRMEWLRAQLRQGILGQDWRGIFLCVIFAIHVYVTNRFYDSLNHGPHMLVLKTPLDERIPLVPAFIIPYVSLDVLAYLSLILFFLFRARIFQSAALTMMTVMLISIFVYMLVPVTTLWARFGIRIALLPVIAGLSYEIIRFAAKHRGSLFAMMTAPGLWLQRITTMNLPTIRLNAPLKR
jgi:hypothetical protein